MIIQALTIERQKLIDALRDVLHSYDRAMGTARGDRGYTASDVQRLEEIRKLVSQ